MSRALAMIDAGIAQGSLSEKDHDRIMELIHKDGAIDELESRKLSELFTAMKEGKLKIIPTDGKKNSSPGTEQKTIIQEAVQRDLENTRKEQTETGIIQKIIPETDHSVSSSLPHDIYTIELTSAEDTSTEEDYFYGLRVHKTKQTAELFKKANDRLLEAELSGRIWIKTGSMIAYQGAISFRREGIAEHGITKLIKRSLSGEHSPLTAAEGSGQLFLADQGKKICLTNLKGVPLYVQSEHLLAFEDSVKWDIQPLFNLGTALAGGLFHVCLSGQGQLAFTSEYDPVVLRVKPGQSIMTDAAATVAWSSGVVPSLKADINLQTLIGRGSGETIQLRFEGDGVVIVQPFESRFEAANT